MNAPFNFFALGIFLSLKYGNTKHNVILKNHNIDV